MHVDVEEILWSIVAAAAATSVVAAAAAAVAAIAVAGVAGVAVAAVAVSKPRMFPISAYISLLEQAAMCATRSASFCMTQHL